MNNIEILEEFRKSIKNFNNYKDNTIVDTVLENIETKRNIYMEKINDFPNYVVIPDNILDILIDTSEEILKNYGDNKLYRIFGMRVISTPIKTKIEEIEVF